MGTLVRMRTNIFTITKQPNFRHQNSMRLHYGRKTENFMENLKIRKYQFFPFCDKNMIRIIQNDLHMKRFYKKLMETVKYM